MASPTMAWVTGLALLGSAFSVSARADGTILGLYNPLGFYVGGGVGRSSINQTDFDQFASDFHHVDGQPVGWNAVMGMRPLSFLGGEVEYIDFGKVRTGALAPYFANQFLGGEVRDRAAAVFAVGYLPLPLPWIEPFVKLGWAQLWEHDSYSGVYDGVTLNGVPLGLQSASQTTHPSGTAYGGGVQFHFAQLAVRAQYERISGERKFGGWNNPDLLSVGLNWTF
ncbi:MAG TPA: outer membrane beta-barrel protein [Steroidobacteraceae bacterium]|nr:outer membrane beta-barrel protein [Steroidobacteraceae bacterium]